MPGPSKAELQAFAKSLCIQLGVPYEHMYKKQIQQESGWEHYDAQGNIKTSSGNAKGVAQIVPESHPTANWADPIESLDYSIRLMARHRTRFDSWKKALAAYNWGPGHVGGGRFDDRRGFGVQDHSPWDGTLNWRCSAGHGLSNQVIHYLQVILGDGWHEPKPDTQETQPVAFSVGEGILNKMRESGDEPATNEQQMDGFAMAFGKSGAMYVYVASTNSNYRFPADR